MTREEAIKVAYGIPVTKEQHEALQFLIPELAESEDEKMRKFLLNYFKFRLSHSDLYINNTMWEGVKVSDIIAYLEKQKEQKHDGKKWIYEDEYQKDLDRLYNEGKDEVLNNPAKYGLQKEQRLLSISAASEWLREHVCNYVNSEYNEFHKCVEYDGSIDKEKLINDFEEAMQKEQKPINESNMHEPTVDEARKWNEAYEKGYSLGYENGRNEQKPAEWSKEDDLKLGALITDIETRSDLTEAIKIKYVSFLKSLRPQPKKEWSEEDEAHRKFILESLEDQIRFCKKDAEGAYYTKQIRTAQNWLNDLPNKFNTD